MFCQLAFPVQVLVPAGAWTNAAGRRVEPALTAAVFIIANKSLLPGPACGPTVDLGPRGLALPGQISVRLPCNISGAVGDSVAVVNMFDVIGGSRWTQLSAVAADGWVDVGTLLPLQVTWIPAANEGQGGMKGSVLVGTAIGCVVLAIVACTATTVTIRRRRARLADTFSTRCGTWAGNGHLRLGPGPLPWEDTLDCSTSPATTSGANERSLASGQATEFLRPGLIEIDGTGMSLVHNSLTSVSGLSDLRVEASSRRAGAGAGAGAGAAKDLAEMCVYRRQALECATSAAFVGNLFPAFFTSKNIQYPAPVKEEQQLEHQPGCLQCEWSHLATPLPLLPGAASESRLPPTSPASSSSSCSLGEVVLACASSPTSPSVTPQSVASGAFQW